MPARGKPSSPTDSPKAGTDRAASEALLQRSYSLRDKEDAVALYRDWAETYDDQLKRDLRYISPESTADVAREWLSDRETPLLDIGCGTGLTAAACRQRGFTTIDGIDISPEMIAVAAKKHLYRKLFQGDLTQTLDLPTASYSAAISSGTFTHAHVGASAFDEIFRILRPGGRLVCTIHSHVFEPAGFLEKIGEMTAAGVLGVLHRHEAPLFEMAPPDGLYYVFERL